MHKVWFFVHKVWTFMLARKSPHYFIWLHVADAVILLKRMVVTEKNAKL